MKHYFLIFITCLLISSCNKEEYYCKTAGEITGEKILELLDEGYPAKCWISSPNFSGSYSFKIDGQFLQLEHPEHNAVYTFDLNQLLYWRVTWETDFLFVFNTMKS